MHNSCRMCTNKLLTIRNQFWFFFSFIFISKLCFVTLQFIIYEKRQKRVDVVGHWTSFVGRRGTFYGFCMKWTVCFVFFFLICHPLWWTHYINKQNSCQIYLRNFKTFLSCISSLSSSEPLKLCWSDALLVTLIALYF